MAADARDDDVGAPSRYSGVTAGRARLFQYAPPALNLLTEASAWRRRPAATGAPGAPLAPRAL